MALSGKDASESDLLNMEQTAESLVPSIFKSVTLAINTDPDTRPLLRLATTISLASGVGTLPPNVPMESLPGATITDPDDDTVAQDMSYVPDYFDYLGAKQYEPRLGYWTVTRNATTGNTLRYIRPTDTVETKSGDVDLTADTEPAVPALYTDTLNAPQEFIDMATVALANALRMKVAA